MTKPMPFIMRDDRHDGSGLDSGARKRLAKCTTKASAGRDPNELEGIRGQRVIGAQGREQVREGEHDDSDEEQAELAAARCLTLGAMARGCTTSR